MRDEAFEALARDQYVGSLATVNIDGLPQVCTIFYLLDGDDIVFKSRAISSHMSSVASGNNQAAFCNYLAESDYAVKAGVQVQGTIRRISNTERMKRLVEAYSSSFPGAGPKFAPLDELLSINADSTLFALSIEQYKVVDSRTGRVDLAYIPNAR